MNFTGTAITLKDASDHHSSLTIFDQESMHHWTI